MRFSLRSTLQSTALAIAMLAFQAVSAWGAGPAADTAALYRTQVDLRLEVPPEEMSRYGKLAEAELIKAGITLSQPQHIAVVDRHPHVQALLLFWRSGSGEWIGVGASPVSTGMPGSYDHFETPLGVFEHSMANPDFRAEGTFNENGIRGYGVKGMRVFDFGWQRVPKGWGDGEVIEMRLQIHASDPDVLERRLGSAQSKGCIRIPASLNRLLDLHGVLDASYEQAAREGEKLWVLDANRQPVGDAGRYLIVVESIRKDRPGWSPPPFLPHRKPVPQPKRQAR